MPDYLLDTNILRYWYDAACAEHARVAGHVHAAKQPDPQTNSLSRMYVSVVTLGEIEYGHRVAVAPDLTKQAAYAKFVRAQCPVAIDVGKHVAEQYGQMRAWLFNNCTPTTRKSKARRAEELVNPATGKELGIDENDIWIAAQAMTHNLALVTHDSYGNYGRVLQQFASALVVEDWTH